jgi:hypothetical protein
MMKAKILGLILMMVVFSLGVVSATECLDLKEISVPNDISHDQGIITVQFSLELDSGCSADRTGLTWDFTSNKAGTWDTSSLPTTITDAEGVKQLSATFNLNSNQNGPITTTIVVDDDDSSDDPEILDLTSINILESTELSATLVTELTKTQNGEISITNTGNTVLTDIDLEVITPGDFEVTFSDSNFNLNPGVAKLVEVSSVNLDSLELGDDNTITVKATDGTTDSETIALTVPISFCEIGDIGDLEMDRLDFTNNGMGDDNEWYLTDEIEVEVRIENTHNDDKIKDIVVSWGLYDEENDKWIIDKEEDEFNLNDGDKETVTFKFTLDPQDFDDSYSEGDFVFYIKAYSKEDGEDVQCISMIEEDVSIMKEDDLVVVDDIDFTSNTLPCGEELSGDFNVWNLGEDNQNEELFIMITNEELGISERVNVGELDSLDDVGRSFSIMVPEDAKEKGYPLKFTIYDEDGGLFVNDVDGDDKDAVFYKTFNVEGECSDSRDKVQITAINDASTPDAVAGGKYIIKATLINMDDETATYTVSVFGNSAWSSLDSIDPQVVTLEAGESKEVSIALEIDEDASGDKELTIKASSSNNEVEQKVALSIESDEAEFDAFSGHVRKNWFIYVIVLVNIILIIAIILVIRSMVRPREVYE